MDRIQNISVTEQVVEYLKRCIASGEWTVGEKIPSEYQLIETLGVSRASVRSALQHLIGLGVLRSYQGKGTYLIDDALPATDGGAGRITAEDCRDIIKVLEFRRLLEPGVCRLAVQRTGAGFADALCARLDEMCACHDRADPNGFVRADLQFHEAICRASENPLAIKSLGRVFQENLRDHERMNALFGDDFGLRCHAALLSAFRAGDADAAADAMARHLQEPLDRLQGMI